MSTHPYQHHPVTPSTHVRHSNYPFYFYSSIENTVNYFLPLSSKYRSVSTRGETSGGVPNVPLMLFNRQVDALSGLLAVVEVLLGEHVKLAVQPACLVPNTAKQTQTLIISTFM